MRAFFKKHCESSQHNIRLHIVRFFAIFLLSTLGTTVWAQDRTDIGAIPEAKYKIHLQKSVMIPMRDGVHLATDLYFPEGAAEPLPVVLIRTPYNKKLL